MENYNFNFSGIKDKLKEMNTNPNLCINSDFTEAIIALFIYLDLSDLSEDDLSLIIFDDCYIGNYYINIKIDGIGEYHFYINYDDVCKHNRELAESIFEEVIIIYIPDNIFSQIKHYLDKNGYIKDHFDQDLEGVKMNSYDNNYKEINLNNNTYYIIKYND